MSDHIPNPGQRRTILYGHYANRTRGARQRDEAEPREAPAEPPPRRCSRSWARMSHSAPSVTLITYGGMVAAFTSALLMAGSHFEPGQIGARVPSGSAAALALPALALCYTLKHRSRLFGYRLIISGATLASVPLAVGAFRMLTDL